jgi:hypothetical protein
MTQSDSDERPNNPLLYRYIQLAYEYANSFAHEPLHGGRTDFLGTEYTQRMRAVLGDPAIPVAPLDAESEQLREWLDGVREKYRDNILSGRIDKLYIRDGSSTIFDSNEARYRRQR